MQANPLRSISARTPRTRSSSVALSSTIYAIHAGSALDADIAPGSGVVGIPRDGGVLIFYEGNLHGASNLHDWRERVLCAAGRLFSHYPTVALRFVPQEQLADLISIGVCTAETPHRGYRIDVEHATEVQVYADRYQRRR